MAIRTRWWWIRHAPVENPENRLYGQSDIDAIIGAPGPYQRLAQRLPAGALWVSSHLRRTRQTAAALAPHMAALGHRVPETVELPELAEQDFGAWQGMTFAEIKAHLGDGFDAFWRAPAEARPPDGESFADVIARVADAVRRLNAEHPGRDIIAVAHGGTIRAALAVALELDPGASLSFEIRNLSLTRIDHVAAGEAPQPATVRTWHIYEVNYLHPEDG